MKKMVMAAAAIIAALLYSRMAEHAKHAPQADPEKIEFVAATPSTAHMAEAAARLTHMRKHLRPYWIFIEAGGIFLLPDLDEAKTATFFHDMAAQMPAPIGGKDIYGMLSEEVSAFFETAKLEAGVYRLENYHKDYAIDGKIRFDSDGHGDTVLPEGERFDFAVTEEHLKLLRHLNTRSWRSIIEAMNPKRPYGDMTYYFIDMSEALGEPPPPRDANNSPLYTKEQIERFLRLHREMLFAVQAFWAYAK